MPDQPTIPGADTARQAGPQRFEQGASSLASDHILLTPNEMQLVDDATIIEGWSGFQLMASAGKAVADAVERRWEVQPVLVLCGPGNNGGDGFVAAVELAAKGWPVRLGLLGNLENLSGDAASHAAQWQGSVEAFSPDLLDGCNVAIDAIFGSGLSRPVEGKAREMIEALTDRVTRICAIDVPSGVSGANGTVLGIAAKAEITVTFFRKKPGHLLCPGRDLCGDIILADIGIPMEALASVSTQTFENGPELWFEDYPWPHAVGHKYQRGHVLILGGPEMTGASRLTALAAMRVGAGLVTLAAPEAAWQVYASALTGTIVRKIDSIADFETLLVDKRRNAIAIGPGIGANDTTRQAVLAALATKRNTVLDADALTAFANDRDTLFRSINGPCVLTPHEGEFARLFDPAGDKFERTRRASALSGAVVLLKGSDTVIAEPGGLAIINSNAPPDLATGGSGDVLTGLITGLLAQGLSPFYAAAAGAWLHGAAATEFGPGLIAEDLPNCVPAVLRRLRALKPISGDRHARHGSEIA